MKSLMAHLCRCGGRGRRWDRSVDQAGGFSLVRAEELRTPAWRHWHRLYTRPTAPAPHCRQRHRVYVRDYHLQGKIRYFTEDFWKFAKFHGKFTERASKIHRNFTGYISAFPSVCYTANSLVHQSSSSAQIRLIVSTLKERQRSGEGTV